MILSHLIVTGGHIRNILHQLKKASYYNHNLFKISFVFAHYHYDLIFLRVLLLCYIELAGCIISLL